MYPLVFFVLVSLFYCNRNIYIDIRKYFKNLIPEIYILTYIVVIFFIKINRCASVDSSNLLRFSLLNDCWKNKFFEKRELNTVKYWLSCQDANKSELCLGTHHFESIHLNESNFYSENDFRCSLGISLFHHEPLNCFENDYSTWCVKFRVLNNFMFTNLDDRPFIFEDYLKVKYHEFRVFVKYLTQKPEIYLHNLSYKLFYKFLGIIEVLNPIRSKFLDHFYFCFLKNGLLGVDSFKIISDSKEYKKKYLKSRKHSLMYFFLVLDDSLDACLDRKISVISLFKKTDQLVDNGFRYVDTIGFIRMNISAYIVKNIVKKFNREQRRIFNWLLYCVEITGFCFDKIEMRYVAFNIPKICDFGIEKLAEVESGSTHHVSFSFFEFLSSGNIERISFLKFENVEFLFDSLVYLFRENALKYFEISYCSLLNSNISSLFQKNTSLEFLKLCGIILSNQDVEAILYLGLKTLVLNKCEMEKKSDRNTKYNNLQNYKILKSLTLLDISSSKLPLVFLGLLLNSQDIKYLNMSSFEFIPETTSKETLFYPKKKWLSLKINNYNPNRYLMQLAESAESIKFLVLSQVSIEGCLKFFFGLHNFQDTVSGLDISGKMVSIEIINSLSGFKQLNQLNVANSLPLSLQGLVDLNLFKTVECLKASDNKIGLNDNNFIAKFQKLTKIDLSNANIQDGALTEILSSKMLDSLIHLDLSGVNLSLNDFRKLCECKSLKYLLIDVKYSLNVSEYVEIVRDANFKEKLEVLCVETAKINIFDFFELSSFPMLKKFRLVCVELEESVKIQQINNKIYQKKLRIEIVYMKLLPCHIRNILCKAFENYYISIVDSLLFCVS